MSLADDLGKKLAATVKEKYSTFEKTSQECERYDTEKLFKRFNNESDFTKKMALSNEIKKRVRDLDE